MVDYPNGNYYEETALESLSSNAMSARECAAAPLAAPSLTVGLISLAGLPIPAWASSVEPSVAAPVTGVMLVAALVALWLAKRRADLALRQHQASLASLRQDWQAAETRWQAVVEQSDNARQAANRERDRLEQALFSSEQRLLRHLECASELVFALDLDGRIQQLSANWRQALGVDPEHLLGQSHAWLVHSDDLPACQRIIERALASRRLQGEVEYRIRHAEGDWHWHAARVAPLFDPGGRMVGLLGVARELGADRRPDALQRAHFDALTGLPGRILCLDRLRQALLQAERHGERTAWLQVELDHFKSLNERWGHAIGDLVLLEVAARIAACVRRSDTVGRAGGDQFMVLLPAVGCEREALEVADKIRRALREPMPLRGQRLALTSSVGVALYPLHGMDEDELSLCAGLAIQRAKDAGRDRIALPDRLPDDLPEILAAA
ncbi:sensor domain-containing diguanylate cyclase [Malikia spinosa]|uniref:Sensor domain-containing diguanylate cyclase n=1 Tax=Malikia spinosa TaxID=86180 RepID=A0A7C9N2E8_9BURK|nr:sensor domain-containing diguanylate cyclase [Malikia spinosa]